MRRISLIGLFGLLALLSGGCGGGDETVAPSPNPTPVAVSPPASPTAPAASPSPTASPAPGQNFNQPVVTPRPPQPAGPDLIQSTNPEERVRVLQQQEQGRQDPFAVVSVPVRVQTQGTETVPGSPNRQNPVPDRVRQLPGVPRTGGTTGGGGATTGRTTGGGGTGRAATGGTGGGGRTPNRGTGATGGGGTGTAPNRRPTPALPSVAVRPLGVPELPDLTPPPEIARLPGTEPRVPVLPAIGGLPILPEPDLARAVEVTGVIQVGNTAQAIVKAPLEDTSRYVGVGALLSNGRVLVKRIEVNQGSAPVVILEQNGVEVAKTVG